MPSNETGTSGLVVFIISVSILLLVGIVSGRLLQKLSLPRVIGELFGGIVLGPTVLGTLLPAAYESLFSCSDSVRVSREVLIKLGAILILFVIGLEVNLPRVRELRRTIVWTSFFGSTFPFLLGMLSVVIFPRLWHYDPLGNTWLLPLFVGTALSVSALPIIARILMDLGMLQTKVGSAILATATIDDITGWILFALISTYFIPDSVSNIDPYVTIIGVLTMFLFAITSGNKLAKKIIAWSEKKDDADNLFLGLTLVLVLLFSALAEKIGVHAMLGGFLVGLAFSKYQPQKMHDSLRKVATAVFSPFYFASVGIGVNLVKNIDLELALLVFAVATIGKVGGVWLGARISKLSTRESLAVGFGMNARGAVGIILVTSAYQTKIVDERAYVALLVMAIMTSVISGPIMKNVLDSGKP